MEIEYKAVCIVNDINMQAEADKLAADGWTTRPDVAPVTIYHLVRVKGMQPQPLAGASGLGQMTIDEDKVFIKGADGKIRKN